MKKNYKLVLAILFLICLFCFSSAGCDKTREKAERTIVDMEGRVVELPAEINRVACISPSATDLMIAFGLGEKIYGTYKSFLYNDWAIEIYPAAADFRSYSYSVSAEQLLEDKIDLVMLQNTENADTLRNAGLPVVALHQYSPSGPFDDEVYDAARIIGEIFGGEAKIKADAWIKEVRDVISDIENKTKSRQKNETVYYVNGEKSKGLFYSDGGNSMISRILNVAGMELATEKYEVLNVHKVSDEEMVSLDPYAMLIGGAFQNALADSLEISEVWSGLTCVKEGRVYRIPVAMVGIENVSAETPVMLKYAASLFNNDYEYDLRTGLKANIEKYFCYKLADNDVDNMCAGLSKTGNRMDNEK